MICSKCQKEILYGIAYIETKNNLYYHIECYEVI